MHNVKWGIIGFGEAGAAFAKHLGKKSSKPIFVTDPLLYQKPLPARILRRLEGLSIEIVPDISQLLATCDIVLSLVTPIAAAAAAGKAASSPSRALFIDFNSTAPAVKQKLGRLFQNERYVDGSILGSVSAGLSATPLALAGPHARQAHASLRRAALQTEVVGSQVGAASAVKVCRSIFMKGIECLFVETLLATEEFKITKPVLRSIEQTLDAYKLEQLGGMLVTTHAAHCARRSEEMEGAIKIMRQIGLPALMSRATRNVLKADCQTGLAEHFEGIPPDDPRDVIEYLRDSYKKNNK